MPKMDKLNYCPRPRLRHRHRHRYRHRVMKWRGASTPF